MHRTSLILPIQKTVKVDHHTFDNVMASLKDADEVQFTQLNESEKIAKNRNAFP